MLRCDRACAFAEGAPEAVRDRFMPLLTTERAALDDMERRLREDAARFSTAAIDARLNPAEVRCDACGFGVAPRSTPDSACAGWSGCVLIGGAR